MFPVDAEGKVTNELPLPPEMARVATERGVFHYNPAQIDEATLLKLSGAKSLAERTAAAATPNFIEAMLAADAAAATATREAAAKEEAARTARQTELAEKKARFEERLAVARQTLADPAASFPAVDGALTSLTSYAEDRSITGRKLDFQGDRVREGFTEPD